LDPDLTAATNLSSWAQLAGKCADTPNAGGEERVDRGLSRRRATLLAATGPKNVGFTRGIGQSGVKHRCEQGRHCIAWARREPNDSSRPRLAAEHEPSWVICRIGTRLLYRGKSRAGNLAVRR